MGFKNNVAMDGKRGNVIIRLTTQFAHHSRVENMVTYPWLALLANDRDRLLPTNDLGFRSLPLIKCRVPWLR